jgi:uncharacterized protein (TIGR02246 family)
MPRTLIQTNTVDDIEQQFYDALNQGDLERLMDCWTRDGDPICIPPGAEVISGMDDIRRLFKSLFENTNVQVAVTLTHSIKNDSHVIHTVLEAVEVTTDEGPAVANVVAVNVYANTSRGWRLQLHHASPGVIRNPSQIPKPPASATIH